MVQTDRGEKPGSPVVLLANKCPGKKKEKKGWRESEEKRGPVRPLSSQLINHRQVQRLQNGSLANRWMHACRCVGCMEMGQRCWHARQSQLTSFGDSCTGGRDRSVLSDVELARSLLRLD